MKTFCRMMLSALILILIPALPIFGKTVLAQNRPPIDIKQYLTAKYNLHEDDVFSTLQQTSGGLRGYLSIKGRTMPKHVPISESIQDRTRAIAKAFLEEEASLLGITNMDEIREITIYSEEGNDGAYTNINYFRYIDDWELRGGYINIKIAPDERIISVEAYLVPTPPELYQAIAEKTLTEAEIRRIIEDDMKADAESPETDPVMKAMINDFDPKVMRPKKFAIAEPPFVIYEVHTAWAYTINALTGEILKKTPIVRVGNTIFHETN